LALTPISLSAVISGLLLKREKMHDKKETTVGYLKAKHARMLKKLALSIMSLFSFCGCGASRYCWVKK